MLTRSGPAYPSQAGISVAAQRRKQTRWEEAQLELKPPQPGARVCALSTQTGHAQFASFSACGRTSCSGGICGFQAVGSGRRVWGSSGEREGAR